MRTKLSASVGGRSRGSYIVLLKDIAMVAHKNEVPLVVEGHHLPTPELWVVGKEGAEKAAHTTAKSRAEVV